jgi:hypothetical protein
MKIVSRTVTPLTVELRNTVWTVQDVRGHTYIVEVEDRHFSTDASILKAETQVRNSFQSGCMPTYDGYVAPSAMSIDEDKTTLRTKVYAEQHKIKVFGLTIFKVTVEV